MEDIKINKVVEPVREVSPELKTVKTDSKMKGKGIKKFLTWTLVILVLAAAFLFGPGIWQKYFSKNLDKMSYSAIFLDNGQVYFGKLQDKNEDEFTLVDVYYLQLTGDDTTQTELSQTRFNLIKLGTELHGPQDILHLNQKHITFWEELRPDSKIVESINNHNK